MIDVWIINAILQLILRIVGATNQNTAVIFDQINSMHADLDNALQQRHNETQQIVLGRIDELQAALAFGLLLVVNDNKALHQAVLSRIAKHEVLILQILARLEEKIIREVNAHTSAEADATRKAVNEVVIPLHDNIDVIEQTQRDLAQSVASDFEEVTSLLELIVGGLGQKIDVTVNNEILLDESLVTELSGQVEAVAKESLDVVESVAQGANDSIATAVAGFLDVLAQLGIGDEDRLIAIRDAILENKDWWRTISEDASEENDSGYWGGVNKRIDGWFREKVFDAIDKLRGINQPQFDVLGDLAKDNDICQLEDLTIGTIDPVAEWLINLMVTLGAVAGLPLAMSAAKVQRCLQPWLRDNPVNVLAPADAAAALHRALISKEQASESIRRTGYSEAQADVLLTIAERLPDIEFAMALQLRGLITEDALKEILRGLGFPETLLDPMIELRFFIPPVQDLITMAVREVFTPEIAAAQGQFDDFPEEFAKQAEKQGVSRENALNYWAAHWALPSPQMGYEMLHRGVIDEEQLKTLLRSLDVMPGWRDAMIAISFSPLTRVDIRRMHALGVLSLDEVKRAYLDIGYNEENAQRLTDFTEQLNADEDLISLDLASDLTRANIVSFYTDGIIDRELALLLLLNASIDPASAELFLTAADLDIERADRKAAKDLVFDQFRTGSLSQQEARDTLMSMGLETRERDNALVDLTRLAQQKDKFPSKEDLDKFFKADLIDASEYLDALSRLGFNAFWSDKYLALVSGEGSRRATG